MSDDRRYDPTPSRRERARRDGDVAVSRELVGIAAFGGALAATGLILAPVGAGAAAALALAVARMPAPGYGACATIVSLALGPALAAAAAGTLTTFVQSGGLRVRAPKIAFGPLAPHRGFARIFGGEAAIGGLRATLAFGTVCAAVTPVVASVVGALGSSGALAAIAGAAKGAAFGAAFAACAVGAIFALGDYALARRRWLRGLRMTFEELRRELREQDGDPHAKQRRRQLHRSFARGGIARTREASFIVVNPTHVAVALRYAPPSVPVPELLVRAADAAALAVRALAQSAGIPIVEDASLARLLYRSGEVGRPIPPATFVGVAQTIAALLRAGLIEPGEVRAG